MIRRRLNKKIFLLLCGDAALFYAALFATLWIRYAPGQELLIGEAHLIPFTFTFALWLIAFSASGLYELRLMKNSKVFLYRLLRVMATNMGIAIVLFYLLPFEIEPRRNLFLIVGLATLFIFIWRYLFNLLIMHTGASRVIFLGISKETIDLADLLLTHPQLGHKPVGFVTNGESVSLSLPSLPVFSLLEKHFSHIIRDTRAELVVISREMKGNKTVVKALLQVMPLGISTVEFPAFHEMLTGKIPLSLIEEVWFLENLIGIKKRPYEFFKRGLDLFLAAFAGSLAALTFPLVALAIKLDSRGPVFFRQKRVGRHGRVFELVKYRSMVEHADTMSGYKGEGIDPRNTRVGALLRKSYLDEAPQIINILRGEMSFVGPRPERPEYVQGLKEKIPFYEMRLLVPPGVSGWAQVNMEDDASVEDAPEKMQYDLYYIKNRSPILDLLIALRTLAAIVRRQGR